MFEKLGKTIEKRPWAVVIFILLITIGFSLFIPSLEFKTNFEDFAPDTEQVQANNRISDYFGMSQQMVFLLIHKEQSESTITPQALRDQYRLQKELQKIPEVNSSVSITTFVDTVCQMEFNKTLENCTDEQISTAVFDLLSQQQPGETQLFAADDPNEPIDYYRSPRGSRGQAEDSVDLKNCYLKEDDATLTFSFEVYSLSDMSSSLSPSIPRTRTMEWYLGFENSLLPPEYAMLYQVAVRIEPTNPFWEMGNGVLTNIRALIAHAASRNLTSYKTTAYLWIRPPGQQTSFPIELKTGNITFDTSTQRINLQVSRKELGSFGIAPQFGSFEIPAKLTNFSAGVRYYQTLLLHRPGGRIVINTSYLLSRISRLTNHPIRAAFITRVLQRYDMNLDDLINSAASMTEMLPSSVSLCQIETLWTTADILPDTGVSHTVSPIIPRFFSYLRVNALSFISTDYSQTQAPKASLMIVFLDVSSGDSALLAQVNNDVENLVSSFNDQTKSVSAQATGESIITTQINDVAMQAMTIIGPMIFILIVCILFIAFRKGSYVALPIIVIAFSSIWLFGTMALLGISFNIIAVALLPLNIGLGVEYSVNLMYNYRIEVRRGRTPAEAIRLSIKEVGVAIFLAWFTTFVAFLSFLSATLPPVRDFGIFLALGITYTFIITMTLLVSLRYIVDRKKTQFTENKKHSFSMVQTMAHLAQVLLRHEKKVFIAAILVCLIMGGAVTQLKSGFNMNQFIPQDNPALVLFNELSEDFPYSSQDQEYILIEGNVATVQILQGIAATHEKVSNDQYVARKSDQTAKTESVYTIIQQAVANNQSLLTRFHLNEKTNIPASDADVLQFYDYLYESSEYGMQFQGVLHKDEAAYTATIIRVYVELSADSEDMTKEFETLKQELNDDLSDYGPDTTSIVTGSLLVTLSILKNMTESQILSTSICFILAAIMLSIIYRNPLLGLIAMIPVSFSIIWVLGTMYFLGYTLNILTITVTSITIGVGIDYSCYITTRFRLVAEKTGDITKAVTETVSRTGSAIFIAALSSMFGFGVLAFAPIPPQQQFGIITAITLIYAFISSILILPLVLARWARWRKKHKGYIISPGAPRMLEGVNEDYEYPGEQ